MKRSLLTPRRALTVLTVLLLIASLLPIDAANRLSSGPRYMVELAMMPVTRWLPLHDLAVGVRGQPPAAVPWDSEAMSRPMLEAEYELALRKIDALEQVNHDLWRQLAQFRQIQAHRGVAGMRGMSLVSARVTGLYGDRRTPMLRIDLGTQHGVDAGMAVTVGASLVGRIEQADRNASTVRLITMTGTDFQVHIKPPPGSNVEPYVYPLRIRVQADGRTFAGEQVAHREPVRVGDLVHLADPRWPDEAWGFFIGQVVEVPADDANPYQFKRVIVQPIPPLYSLSRVTVVVPTQ